MKSLLLALAATASLCATVAFADQGWTDLFEKGKLDAWRSAKSESFPQTGWALNDGVLTVHKAGGEESRGGGDIITRAQYSDFELQAEFRMTAGCNSGIKIFVQPDLSPIDKATGKVTAVGSAIGLEFQILDDERHPDAKLGRDGDRTIGSLYDLIPASAHKVVKPMGEWNSARILVKGTHVEFWLNGAKTVEFERGSPAFRDAVAKSKFRDIPQFGEWPTGHLLLQDHGDEVSFRNVRIRDLSAK